MERFSNRENVLLGYSFSPTSDSDIDFADVFGGPPRRQSLVHEMRHSFSGTTEGSTVISSTPSSSVRNEKPVFGDEVANSRWRFAADDFFNDIFRGNESACSSPRKKNELDSFRSNPGSRVMSPTRPLPPKAEPFGTSLPSQFSLPSRLAKGTDLPTLGSPSRSLHKKPDIASSCSSYYSHSPLSRSSNRKNPIQDQQNDVSPSHPKSLSSAESPQPMSDDAGKEAGNGNLETGLDGSEVSRKGRQFHFSIYKWPNKGVPVVIPLGRLSGLRFKEKAKSEVAAEELLPSTAFDDDIRDRETNPIDKETIVNESENLSSHISDVKNVRTNTKIPGSAEWENKSFSVSEKSLPGKSGKGTYVPESKEPKLKPSGTNKLSKKEVKKESKVKTVKEHSAIDSEVLESKKKPDGTRNSKDSAKPAKSSFSSSLPKTGKIGKDNEVKGKVREFVEIFNQEASVRTGGESLGQSSRFKARDANEDENKIGTDNIRAEETVEMSNEPQERPKTDVPEQKSSRFSKKQDPNAKNINTKSRCVSGQEDGQESTRITSEDMDESFHVNFQVKELTEDEDILLQAIQDTEETRAIDAKIKKWSSGKAGNIRSLLSTLQYILWSESGWKPVPLMDMIEGNAVRRSYQKALLILHPDKLQQKGASSNQKYIAEKVFELLQEAWDHFNSLAPL